MNIREDNRLPVLKSPSALLEKTGGCLLPMGFIRDDAGKYIRFSVTFEADSIQKEIEVIEEMKSKDWVIESEVLELVTYSYK